MSNDEAGSWVATLAIIALVAAFLWIFAAYSLSKEARYRLVGVSTQANVTDFREFEERRGTRRRRRTVFVREIDCEFKDGESVRREKVRATGSHQPIEQREDGSQIVFIEYLPGVSGASRLPGRTPWTEVVLLGCASLYLGAFGSVIFWKIVKDRRATA